MIKKRAGVFILSLGLLFVTDFSAAGQRAKQESFEITYDYLDQKQCSKDIQRLIKSGTFRLSFDTEDYSHLFLTGSPTEGVTVESPKELGNEGLANNPYAYILTKDSKLTLQNGSSYRLSQLWVEGVSKKGPWNSGFYLGDNKECLVADHRIPHPKLNGL